MLKIGDKVRHKVKIYEPGGAPGGTETTVEATVVWIHPQRRFYTIECIMPGGRIFRETEYFYPRKEKS